MTYKLAFTTCPNDTFSFDAMVNHRLIDNGLDWDLQMHDIEQLNEKAIQTEFDVVKISVALYPFIQDDYQILTAGAALGFGCGPLVIAKEQFEKADLKNKSVLLPGKYTTAHLLFSIFAPEVRNKSFKVFSEIQNDVVSGEVNAGVIIHENRFTYKDIGLHCLQDLGNYWEEKTKLPIPLGCIAVKRSLSDDEKQLINNRLSKSVSMALKNPDLSKAYVSKYAQEMDEDVQRQHIELYVNDFSIDLGERGKEAVLTLLNYGAELGILPALHQKELFIK
ncbi:MAG: 1,4-dihydroxy-6-naphthoate synthase [Bacteroidia bacterium]|nr:1,4-dihydroxy-6-naphthoate synthase [Bacteroidia bacterium]NNC86537.1 1,4-dihydroxy-6-naphthoate synthase [Bacteroidia bacterium]NNM16007.1 1,4-dihydroxy-6-naphthoate synthase [Bacteroidia bacterium]